MKIKKIILSLFFIGCFLLAILLIKNVSNKANYDGIVNINVIDKNQTLISSKSINFYEGDTLQIVLENNFENVKIEYNAFSDILLSIENLKTDFINNYIKIIVNGKYSHQGISSIKLENNMIIDLIEEKVLL